MSDAAEHPVHVDEEIRSQYDSFVNYDSEDLATHFGIRWIHISRNKVVATMPITSKVKQPYGRLHGGASVAFAETIASFAATLWLDPAKEGAVGLEINANHVRPVGEGFVIGTGVPIHIGRKTHVWGIEIRDEKGKLVCVSRCTVSVIPLDTRQPKRDIQSKL
jgi:1,4-dihydroxy-2-naphthoyl-CoA hydrolase